MNQALNFVRVDEVDGGFFIAVFDNFVEGKMKLPFFGSRSERTAFASVFAGLGLPPRAFSRSAPTHFANLRAFLSSATAHIAPVEIKTA